MAETLDYVSKTHTKLTCGSGKKKFVIELLWGDQVRVLERGNERCKVRARGITGWVETKALGGKPLLELYFIDVGQGDGVLIVTPDRKHVLLDGGYLRSRQPMGKNAADFVDWKFCRDYGKKTIELDAMIASHCDADHYGGLWDLLSTSPEAQAELDAKKVEVGAFFHAGVSWWKESGHKRWLGPPEDVDGDDYLLRLLGDRDDLGKALAGPEPILQGEWADFLQTVYDHGCPVERLSHHDAYVPGFWPEDGPVSIKVLAPVEYDVEGEPALRMMSRSHSQNTNGHSLLLRVDYGRSRILLTGDLNRRSMQHLLGQIEHRFDLQCDVTKGCHHGSDDVSYEFLQAMGASATIISSGDNEGHAHPRPTIVAASAITGHLTLDDDELRTPLIYSTEIARSVSVGRLTHVHDEHHPTEAGDLEIDIGPEDDATMKYDVVQAGCLRPTHEERPFTPYTRVVAGVIYGLVNVRTDGETILCATRNETDASWEIETFPSRF